MVEIEIDGKVLEAEPGSMIIEAADNAGIYIPRFCYHKKLSVAANCRMCLVDVEKAPKPLPACATPVMPGMKVSTCSEKAKDAQRSVMEFLLINHPLDCPICDQGGECELQDLSLGYGKDISRYSEAKRSVDDDNLGSLIATEMTRCIHCTRCVRFGQEIAGIKELGMTGRGEHARITTYIEHSLTSELSGNIIDLCPVGALTSKPYRFTARAWELNQHASIAPHDCLGSNIYIHTRRQQNMRVVPRENDSINETWLSDRDRFSYVGLNSNDRLTKPLVKVEGEWQETDWQTALAKVTAQFHQIIEQHGGEQVAAIMSPSSTTEEFYLLQKIMRGLGSNNIDHRIHQTDSRDDKYLGLFPKLEIPLQAIEKQNAIFLVGSNIKREQPLAWHRIRKASLAGANISSLNAVDYDVQFNQQAKIITSPANFLINLLAIAKVLSELNSADLSVETKALLQDIRPSAEQIAIANTLHSAEQSLILLGAVAFNHPQAAAIRQVINLIADMSNNAKLGYLTEGANSAGAWLAGAIPHQEPAGETVGDGLSANQAFEKQLKAYLLFNIEPELDCTNTHQARNALKNAECVVAFSPFKANNLLEYADIILPMAAFAETSGTFVNVEGHWQSFTAANPAPGETRPAWKILRVLGNFLHLTGFNYESSEEVRNELKNLLTIEGKNDTIMPREFKAQIVASSLTTNDSNVYRVTEWSLNAIDPIVRRSIPLQKSAATEKVGVYINAKLAEQLKLTTDTVTVQQNGVSIRLPLIIDARIADSCAWIPAGWDATAVLGSSSGVIELYA